MYQTSACFVSGVHQNNAEIGIVDVKSNTTLLLDRHLMARSRNHCCSGKATIHSARVVELHVTASYRY